MSPSTATVLSRYLNNKEKISDSPSVLTSEILKHGSLASEDLHWTCERVRIFPLCNVR